MDYVTEYRDYLVEVKHSSANTVSSYLRDVNQFLAYLEGIGQPDALSVRPETIKAYMTWMLGQGKSATSVTRSVASLKSTLR